MNKRYLAILAQGLWLGDQLSSEMDDMIVTIYERLLADLRIHIEPNTNPMYVVLEPRSVPDPAGKASDNCGRWRIKKCVKEPWALQMCARYELVRVSQL